MTIRVALVDDDTLTLDALRRMLSPHQDIVLVGICRSVDELIRTCDADPPHVVVLDVLLSRGTALAENVAQLRRWGTQVLAISSQPERREVAEAVQRLQLNFVAKTELTEERRDRLYEAIQQTANGDLVLSPLLAHAIVRGTGGPRFTEREREAAALLATGMPVKQVAHRMGIREDTVRDYEKKIQEKFLKAGRRVDNRVLLYRAVLHEEIIPDLDQVDEILANESAPPSRDRSTSADG